MGIFPRVGQRSKILLPIRTNLTEYNELPELTTISTTTSIPSVQDGPTVVARYRNLMIGAGATLTTQNRCCGLVLIVDGDLTIGGTISMTARGASFQPSADYRIKNDLLPGNDILYEIDIPATAEEIASFLAKEKRRYHSLDELPAIFRPTLYCRGPHGGIYAPADLGVIPEIGGVGGSGTSQGSGGTGGVGTNRACGGGGAGGAINANSVGGSGGSGTCYSGGSGGGGSNGATSGGVGSSLGGAGGAGGGNYAAGGAGNPGGVGGYSAASGANGTGGLLVIICTGKITVQAGGSIRAFGSAGGAGSLGALGGGSGGGSINLFYGDSLTNGGSISAAGGAGGAGGGTPGGAGGDGCVTTDHYNF